MSTETKKESADLVPKLCGFILQSPKGVINERDLRNLCEDDDQFQETMPEVVNSLQQIGLSLSRTSYQNEKVYVLTSPGKDELLSPAMYGVLGLIIALANQLGVDLEVAEAKKLLKDVWEDVDSLIKANYLQEIAEGGKNLLKIMPIGKAAFKNVMKELDIKKILSLYENSPK